MSQFKVIRTCCQSGNCIVCLAGWNKKRRLNVVHIDGLTKSRAESIAKNWSAFEPLVMPQDAHMPQFFGERVR